MFAALFAISVVSTLVRILGRAAGGKLPTEAVLATVGFTAVNYLPVLVALAIFVSVLLALSRSYRDSEMVVWFTAGQPLTAWIGPVLSFVFPFVVLTAGLSLGLAPWANERLEEYREQLASREETSHIAPGVFVESANADRVFFVESLSKDQKRVENVFVSFKMHGRDGIMVAQSGYVENAADGNRYAVLLNGRRYEGTPGTPEYRVMDFKRYTILIQEKEAQAPTVPVRGIPTLTLIRQPTRENLGELLWRIGLPLIALNLALLAIPLAFVNPRATTSLNLAFAVFAYMVYTNLLSVAEAQVAQGKLSFAIGWWIVHAVMFAAFLMMLWYRTSLRRQLAQLGRAR